MSYKVHAIFCVLLVKHHIRNNLHKTTLCKRWVQRVIHTNFYFILKVHVQIGMEFKELS